MKLRNKKELPVLHSVKPIRNILNCSTKVSSHKNNNNNNNSNNKSNKTVKDIYTEFAVDSTIHGVKYTVNVESTWGKIFWIIIILLSVVASTFLAMEFYEKHHAANMRTLIVTKFYPSWKIEFPAVTFCHSNLASMERIDKFLNTSNLTWPDELTEIDFKRSLRYIREVFYPTNKYERQLNNLHKILTYNNITVHKLLKIVNIPCNNFIILCRFEEEIVPCKKILKPSLSTEGLCCSFNYAYIDGTNSWINNYEPIYSALFGGRYILSVLIKYNSPKDKVSFTTHGAGVGVIVHDSHSYTNGPMSRKTVVSTGHEAFVFVSANVFSTTEEIRNLPLEQRQCFLIEKSKNTHRANNCFMRCQEDHIRSLCGCVPFYAYFINKSHDRICDLTDIPCLAENKHKYSAHNYFDDMCSCYFNCKRTLYSISTTELPMNAPQFNPSVFYKTAVKNPQSTAIHITFTRQTMTQQRRELVLSWINLLCMANLGGVFSLFLGCSFISALEIVYYTFYIIWKFFSNKFCPAVQ